MVFDKFILVRALDMFIQVLKILVIIRIVLSFIIRDLRNPLLRTAYQITEPLLVPFRNLIYKLGINTGMIDFSPILAFVFFDIVRNILIRLLI